MAGKYIDYRQIESLYETCGDGRDLKEFCKDAGVNYESFVNWRRKGAAAKKRGTATPVMAPIEITDVPDETAANNESVTTCQGNGANTIRFVEIKFSDGISLRRFNMEVNDLISLLTKLASALC